MRSLRLRFGQRYGSPAWGFLPHTPPKYLPGLAVAAFSTTFARWEAASPAAAAAAEGRLSPAASSSPSSSPISLSDFSAIHHACKEGRAFDVFALIERKGVSMHAETADSKLSALHVAALYGQNNVVSFLVQKGAERQSCSAVPELLTPVHAALSTGAGGPHAHVLHTLLLSDDQLNINSAVFRGREGQDGAAGGSSASSLPVLHTAVRAAVGQEGARGVGGGATFSLPAGSPTLAAAQRSLALLLKAGAAVDTTNPADGSTALHVAAAAGEGNMTQQLLKAGANDRKRVGTAAAAAAAGAAGESKKGSLLRKEASGMTALQLCLRYSPLLCRESMEQQEEEGVGGGAERGRAAELLPREQLLLISPLLQTLQHLLRFSNGGTLGGASSSSPSSAASPAASSASSSSSSPSDKSTDTAVDVRATALETDASEWGLPSAFHLLMREQQQQQQGLQQQVVAAALEMLLESTVHLQPQQGKSDTSLSSPSSSSSSPSPSAEAARRQASLKAALSAFDAFCQGSSATEGAGAAFQPLLHTALAYGWTVAAQSVLLDKAGADPFTVSPLGDTAAHLAAAYRRDGSDGHRAQFLSALLERAGKQREGGAASLLAVKDSSALQLTPLAVAARSGHVQAVAAILAALPNKQTRTGVVQESTDAMGRGLLEVVQRSTAEESDRAQQYRLLQVQTLLEAAVA